MGAFASKARIRTRAWQILRGNTDGSSPLELQDGNGS